jgi:hypothetical protein
MNREADLGDTTTVTETLAQAGETVADLSEREVGRAPQEEPQVNLGGIEEVVADKGYQAQSPWLPRLSIFVVTAGPAGASPSSMAAHKARLRSRCSNWIGPCHSRNLRGCATGS